MKNNVEIRFDELSVGKELMTIADELVESRSVVGLIALSGICHELINKGIIDGNLECNYSFVSISDYTSFAVEAIEQNKSTEEIKSNWQRPEPDDFTKTNTK